jgi:ribonuclease HII
MQGAMMKPTFSEEQTQWQRGYRFIAGIDEAGRGPLAGPVVAAAVILPAEFQSEWLHLVADSKVISASRREFLYKCLYQAAVAVGVGVIDVPTIDMVGIAKATRLAMKMAVKQLDPKPDYLLIDYFRLPEVRLPQKGVTDGDSLCLSIASASIIAKVTRDRIMIEFDRIYPGYQFAAHKGYGTREHFKCLQRLGASPIHRRSFQPVRDVCNGADY